MHAPFRADKGNRAESTKKWAQSGPSTLNSTIFGPRRAFRDDLGVGRVASRSHPATIGHASPSGARVTHRLPTGQSPSLRFLGPVTPIQGIWLESKGNQLSRGRRGEAPPDRPQADYPQRQLRVVTRGDARDRIGARPRRGAHRPAHSSAAPPRGSGGRVRADAAGRGRAARSPRR